MVDVNEKTKAKQKKDFSSGYTYGEGRTANGQLVEFTCCTEDGEVDRIKKFLKENIRTIDIPTTGRVNITHGGYGQYTRYDIKQHDYAGGGPGDGGGWCLIEVLEIKNPPDGRWGIVIHENGSRKGAIFTEWETIEDARAVFKKHWGIFDDSLEFRKKLKGFRRQVICGQMRPWFYAIGDEELIGDYAFPEGFQDDPVYRFGRKFVVFGFDGVPEIKTCMGARFLTEDVSDGYNRSNKYHKRLVYWDDGKVWQGELLANPPRPLEDGEIWVVEAIKQFRELLSGAKDRFTINFANGGRFVGNFLEENRRVQCAEGDYELVVRLEGGEQMDGWVSFKPTSENPSVVEYVKNKLESDGKKIESIRVANSKTNKKGKRWAGVYYIKRT